MDINSLKQRQLLKKRNLVSREIKRNSDKRNGTYKHELANRKYRYRQKTKLKHKRFTKEVQDNVENLLRKDYSPEQVVGKLKNQNKSTVSVERIYQHVWQDKKKKGSLHKHLRPRKRFNFENPIFVKLALFKMHNGYNLFLFETNL